MNISAHLSTRNNPPLIHLNSKEISKTNLSKDILLPNLSEGWMEVEFKPFSYCWQLQLLRSDSLLDFWQIFFYLLVIFVIKFLAFSGVGGGRGVEFLPTHGEMDAISVEIRFSKMRNLYIFYFLYESQATGVQAIHLQITIIEQENANKIFFGLRARFKIF